MYEVKVGSLVECVYFMGTGPEKKRLYTDMGTRSYIIGDYIIGKEEKDVRVVSYDSFIGRALLGGRVGETRYVSMGIPPDGSGGVDFKLQITRIVPTDI